MSEVPLHPCMAGYSQAGSLAWELGLRMRCALRGNSAARSRYPFMYVHSEVGGLAWELGLRMRAAQAGSLGWELG